MNVDFGSRFKSKRVLWTHDELVLCLAYYFFIYGYNTRKKDYSLFASNLREKNKNNRSDGSVGVRFGNFISIDPRKKSKGFKNGGSVCKDIWDECIDINLKPKSEFVSSFYEFIQAYGKNNLRIYNQFLMKYKMLLKKKIDIDDENDIVNSEVIDNSDVVVANYQPESKPELVDETHKKYKRNPNKAKKSIILSKFKCNINSNHLTFDTKNNKPYMEAHHLIPMASQDTFDVSLDIDANILCLCATCHRKLHYGLNIREDLKKLYYDRKELLKQSGVDITFEKLLKYYE